MLKVALILALAGVLLASSIVDMRSRRLPDPLTVAAAGLSLALAALDGWRQVAIGAAVAALSWLLLEGVRRAFLRRRGRPGLGQGDVKLFAALALWLGLAAPWALAIASLLGLIAAWRLRPADGRIAFGPAIAAAAWGLCVVREAGFLPDVVSGGLG